MRIANTFLPLELWLTIVCAGPIHQPYRLNRSLHAKKAPFPLIRNATPNAGAAGETGKVPAVGSGDQSDLSSLQSSVQAAATQTQFPSANSEAGRTSTTSLCSGSSMPTSANGQAPPGGQGELGGQSSTTLISSLTATTSAPLGLGTNPPPLSTGASAPPNPASVSSSTSTSFSRSFSLFTSSTSAAGPPSSANSSPSSVGAGTAFSTGFPAPPASSTVAQATQTILIVLSMPTGETTVTMSIPQTESGTLTVHETLGSAKTTSPSSTASSTPSGSPEGISIVPLPTATAGGDSR